jgi:hypothetical protein
MPAATETLMSSMRVDPHRRRMPHSNAMESAAINVGISSAQKTTMPKMRVPSRPLTIAGIV